MSEKKYTREHLRILRFIIMLDGISPQLKKVLLATMIALFQKKENEHRSAGEVANDYFSEDEFEFSYGPPGELAKQLHFTDEHMEAILAILGTKKLKVASKLSAIKMLIAYFLSDDPQPVEVLTNFVLLLHEKELKPKKDR